MVQLVSLILTHWTEIYPMDSAIQLLNNWGLNKRGSIYVHLLKISIPASEDARPVLPGPNCPKVINASPVLVNKTTHMVYLQLRWDLPH